MTSRHTSAVLARLLGAAATLFLLSVILGCMSISFEGRKHIIQNDDQTYSQTSKISIPAGQEVEIYYPIPYVGPPNLVCTSDFSECKVIEQRSDHFRVKNSSGSPREFTWTARGMKGYPAVFPPPPVTPEVVPTAKQ